MKRLAKKGSSWMTEETGKFLISVLVIVLLIMLVVRLVSLFTTNNEYEQAKATLENIYQTSSSMGEGDQRFILLEGPKGWMFLKKIDNPNFLCLCKSNEDCLDNSLKKSICMNFKKIVQIEGPTSNCPGSGYLVAKSGCLHIDYIPKNLNLELNQNLSLSFDKRLNVEQVGQVTTDSGVTVYQGDSKDIDHFVGPDTVTSKNFFTAEGLRTETSSTLYFEFKDNQLSIIEKPDIGKTLSRKVGFVDQGGVVWLAYISTYSYDKSFWTKSILRSEKYIPDRTDSQYFKPFPSDSTTIDPIAYKTNIKIDYAKISDLLKNKE